MAKLHGVPTVTLKLKLVLDEGEARALDALVGYGDDAFIAAFKDKLGAAYLRGNEAGLRSFFKSVRQILPGLLLRADRARNAFVDSGYGSPDTGDPNE